MSRPRSPRVYSYKNHMSRIKAFIEATFGCRIYRFSAPRGTDLYLDLEREFGLKNFRTVFDIGANVGQSARLYLRQFSAAKVYSFEPVRSTFQELVATTPANARLQAFQCGFGDQTGSVSINVNPDSR